MPSMSGNVTLVADTRSANQLSGEIYEFLPFTAQVNVYAVASAATGNPKMRLTADQDIVQDDQEIHFIGTTISKSDHLVDSFTAAAGSRLKMDFLSAGTEKILWIVEVVPL